ncbi:MAG: hypothetical protein EXS37_00800 [Opitutus sp.]|nr:hypothetical protein [Opitutus sp.]
MAESRSVLNWRRAAGFAALAAFAAALVIAATLMMFSRFMLYDDEGYVLISLRNFAEHGNLYRDVYTQYGPLPYVFYYLLNVGGAPITHLTGRLVTLVAWSGAAFFSCAIVWRATRSHALMAAVTSAVFVYLWIMVSEPSHPGGLIALMVAGLAGLGAHWLAADRRGRWAALAGAGVAALVLTKINVGVFAAISAGAFMMLNHRSPALQRWAPFIIAPGFALLPFALMRPLLHAPWVQIYAVIFSVSAAAASGAAAIARQPLFGWAEVRAAILGAAAVAFGVGGIVLCRGTTPGDLLQGVLLGPLRHPISFSLVFKWAPGATAVAVASGAVFLAVLGLRRKGRIDTADLIVSGARLIAVAGLVSTVGRFPAISADNLVLSFGAPCLWLFVWPLAGDPAGSTTARTWIGLLLLGQFLHPFPVPGSQIAWGTFLAIPLAALGAWEAAGWLARRFGPAGAPRRSWSVLGQTALAGFAGFVGLQLAQVGRQYFDGRTLALPGAEQIRLPDESTARYQLLTFNAIVHADRLFSLPGMFSFNLWSGLPTPTLANVTHWFSLLTSAQQQAIIRELEAHPRAAVIVETGHLNFLRQRGLAPAGLLYDYIENSYAPAFSVDGFEFRVRQGRRVAPFFTAEVFKRPVGAKGIQPVADPENTRLVLTLLLPADQAIASVEILSLKGFAPPLQLRGANVRIEVTSITPQGNARGPAQVRALPLGLSGPSTVALYFDGQHRVFDLADTLIVLRNAAGTELGLVRLRP